MVATTKKTTKRRPAAKTRKPSSSLAAAKKTSKKPAQHQLSIPLGRGRKFNLAVSVTDGIKKKKKKTSTKKKTAQSLDIVSYQLILLLIILGTIGTIFFTVRLFTLGTAQGLAPPAPVSRPAASAPTRLEPDEFSLAASDATRVQIADIGVDAEVLSIAKYRDGTLEVPSDAAKVGQYSLGPTPGEVGPAIIVGHVDSLTGPAVFWRLREMLPGQMILITRQDGSVARFKVDTVQEYAQDAFPTNEVYGNIDHAGLRLITCGGSFNVFTQHYTNNTVVYASLIQ